MKEYIIHIWGILDKQEYSKQGLVRDIKYGIMSHKRTIFVATLKHKGKEFIVHYDFGYEYPEDNAKYMFLEGDDSCDCNRSLFIRREYGEESIPELSCGNSIELIDYHFEYVD